jgi:hypothetical protein
MLDTPFMLQIVKKAVPLMILMAYEEGNLKFEITKHLVLEGNINQQ